MKIVSYSAIFFVCVLDLCAPLRCVAEPAKVKIGIIAPLSGTFSEYGAAVRNAVDLARSDQPKLFNSTELILEDSQSDSKAAVGAFEKLASTGVDAVVIWGTTPTEAVAPVAERRQIPLIAMSISPSVSKDRKFVIRSIGPAEKLIEPLAKYIIDKGYHQISLLKTEWSYTEEIANALKSRLQKDVRFKQYDFQRDEKDFRSNIAKLSQEKTEALGVLLGTGQISTFFKQLEQSRQSFEMFGTGMFASEKEIADSGSKIQGAIFPDLAVCDTFSEKYTARFNVDAHLAYAVNIYDITLLLGEVVTSLNDMSKSKFFDEIKKTKTHKGICGNFQFIEEGTSGYFDYPVALYRVKNNKYYRVEK